jgi:MFS family permease
VLAFVRTPGTVRRFLLAALQSSVGNAVGYVALLLVTLDRTDSPWAVSVVLLADFLPAIALAPVFGALADRYPRRPLCVGADLLRCAAFVGLAFAGSFAAIVALATVAGVGTALFHPASKSALADLAAPRGDVAMGALVTVWSAASVVGPALAALLLLAFSPAVLLLADAATFLASGIVLSRLRLDGAKAATGDGAVTGDGAGTADVAHGVGAGLRAASAVDGLSTVIGVGAASTLAFSLMNVAEPLLATDELHTGGAGFALLVCLYGVGSTLGTLRGRAQLPVLVTSLAGGGLALCASALAQSLTLAAVTFLLTGLFAGAVMSSDHQLIARLAPDAIRGRVFGLKDALDAIAFCAAVAGGGLIASLSDSRAVFAISGAGALVVAAVATGVLRRARLRTAPSGERRRPPQTGRRARGARRAAGF